MIAYGGGPLTAFEVPDEGANSTAQLVANQFVSGNYFQELGVTPAVGRVFTPDDNSKEDAHPSVTSLPLPESFLTANVSAESAAKLAFLGRNARSCEDWEEKGDEAKLAEASVNLPISDGITGWFA